MSKLSDKIRSVTRSAPMAIGFGAHKSAGSATMVLAGIAADAGAATEAAKRGADVVIVGSAAKPVAASTGKGIGDAIAGAVIAGRVDNEASEYKDGGFDFVVFDPDSASATALLEENVGYVISLPADLTDNEVRTLESFQLDAIDVGTIERPLTVRRQIDLRRIFGMTRKPLMTRVDAAISSVELQALRDTNVVVVAVEGAENIERLRKTIDALPPRARRKDEDRPTPLVPRATAADDEDEDEHDHDSRGR